MPGFGRGYFGQEPFGKWAWSKQVLYDFLPEVYKAQDTNGLLRDLTEGFRPPFDNLREKVTNYLDLRDPLLVRSQYDEASVVTLGAKIVPQGALLQRGIDGKVTGYFSFTAASARFKPQDAGRELVILNSKLPGNNKKVVIAQVMTTTTVRTYPALLEDDGPLRWELREAVKLNGQDTEFEVLFGDLSRVTKGYKLWDGFSQFEIIDRQRMPDRTIREGEDGSISQVGSDWVFYSDTIAFTASDYGCRLSISNAVKESRNRDYEIRTILNANEVILAGDDLADEAGPLQWAVRPRPTITVAGSAAQLKGYVERYGFSGNVAGDTANLPTANFLKTDVNSGVVGDEGKLLTFRYPFGNGGVREETYKIVEVVNSNVVFIDGVSDMNGLWVWELRSTTQAGDASQVELQASSLIEYLAKDHAIEVERQEPETRQRSWVANVSRWTNIKGLDKAYKIIASVSGFEADVDHLWSVGQALYELRVPLANRIELGVQGRKLYGTNGSFGHNAALPATYFTSGVDAPFKPSDVGSFIRIIYPAIPEITGMWPIVGFQDATTVLIGPLPLGGDVVVEQLPWRLVRPYTDLEPLTVDPAEVDSSAGQALNPNFCPAGDYVWEKHPSTGVPVQFTVQIILNSVNSQGGGLYVCLFNHGWGNPMLAVGGWYIQGPGDERWWIESIDYSIPGAWSISFYAETPPTSGVWLTAAYEPKAIQTTEPAELSYIGTNKVLAVITEDTVLSDPEYAIAPALDRVLARLIDVTPAHVELVPRFRRVFEATIAISATFTAAEETFPEMLAPLTRHFDEFVADQDELPDTPYTMDTPQVRANVEAYWIDSDLNRHPITE